MQSGLILQSDDNSQPENNYTVDITLAEFLYHEHIGWIPLPWTHLLSYFVVCSVVCNRSYKSSYQISYQRSGTYTQPYIFQTMGNQGKLLTKKMSDFLAVIYILTTSNLHVITFLMVAIFLLSEVVRKHELQTVVFKSKLLSLRLFLISQLEMALY